MSVVTNMLRTQKRADDPFMYQYNCLSAETSTTNKILSPHLTTISERALNHTIQDGNNALLMSRKETILCSIAQSIYLRLKDLSAGVICALINAASSGLAKDVYTPGNT